MHWLYLYPLTPFLYYRGCDAFSSKHWAEGRQTPWTCCQSIMRLTETHGLHLTWMKNKHKPDREWQRQELSLSILLWSDGAQTASGSTWAQDDSAEVKGRKCMTAFLTPRLSLESIFFCHSSNLYLLCYLTFIYVCVCVCARREIKKTQLTSLKINVRLPSALTITDRPAVIHEVSSA